MKRYDLNNSQGDGWIEESVDGEYVTYEDHVEAMKRIAGDGGQQAEWPTPEMMEAFTRAYKGGSIWTDRLTHAVKEMLRAAPASGASPEQHPDNVAVDMFAKAMKEKLALARAKGRGGWQTCNKYELSNMLRDHVEKGDPRDVANFCMFLHALGHPIQIAPSASPWASINPAATLADHLDELPEINFSNYDQGDVEALQAWAIEAYTLLNASPATNVKKEG